jgi:hypothetical protein
MIIGAHSIIYSKNPEADRAFLRDVLKLTNVDVGDGWLIFGLPPSEVAVHPSDKSNVHEFYLMVDGISTGRSDGALVRLTTRIEADETDAQADARLSEVMKEVMKPLPRFVPQF